MKRTTVFLSDALLARTKQVARSEGRSIAALVRDALDLYLGGSRGRRGSVPGIAGQFASGTPGTSERVEDSLWREPRR